jgi:hypothetical protein
VARTIFPKRINLKDSKDPFQDLQDPFLVLPNNHSFPVEDI